MARETLSRDQIVTATLDLLDAEGLEGMNMRALGKRLSSAATAVYWHVGSRESLIALAADRAWAEIELFPRLRARLELPSAGYGAAPDGSFQFGLQAVLDGLEARLATRAKSDSQPG